MFVSRAPQDWSLPCPSQTGHWPCPLDWSGHWPCPLDWSGHWPCPLDWSGHWPCPLDWSGHWPCPLDWSGHWPCPLDWSGHWPCPSQTGHWPCPPPLPDWSLAVPPPPTDRITGQFPLDWSHFLGLTTQTALITRATLMLSFCGRWSRSLCRSSVCTHAERSLPIQTCAVNPSPGEGAGQSL